MHNKPIFYLYVYSAAMGVNVNHALGVYGGQWRASGLGTARTVSTLKT